MYKQLSKVTQLSNQNMLLDEKKEKEEGGRSRECF